MVPGLRIPASAFPYPSKAAWPPTGNGSFQQIRAKRSPLPLLSRTAPLPRCAPSPNRNLLMARILMLSIRVLLLPFGQMLPMNVFIKKKKPRTQMWFSIISGNGRRTERLRKRRAMIFPPFRSRMPALCLYPFRSRRLSLGKKILFIRIHTRSR